MLYRRFHIHIYEAYGDNEYSEEVYAYTRDIAYSIGLKLAKRQGFDFPVITVTSSERSTPCLRK